MSRTTCHSVRHNIVQQNQPQNSIPTEDDDSSINSIAGSIQSPPKGSVLDHIDRPISPTSVESFPYFEVKHSEVTQASVELAIHATSNRRIPTLITNKAEIQATVDSLEYQDTTANNYDIEDCSIVEEYTVIADLGTYYKTFVINTASPSPTSNSTLADTGANCSMTANIDILKNVRKLDTPIIVGTAVTNS
eukprot:scaffold70958_cov23-Cyclotella_meneghiniana.AAC.1